MLSIDLYLAIGIGVLSIIFALIFLGIIIALLKYFLNQMKEDVEIIRSKSNAEYNSHKERMTRIENTPEIAVMYKRLEALEKRLSSQPKEHIRK